MSQLTIFKASAGSGKTYRLVAEYIKLLIEDPYKYKHILAVTFTNKATSEMKGKILNSLSSLTSGESEKLMNLLVEETSLEKGKIIENSAKALSLILHDYDSFSVNTIDSFFQRVLRSFARESGLFGSYDVDLNQDEMLEEACDKLLLSVKEDKDLMDWLLMMAEEQMEENKGWQVRGRIVNFGKEIYKDSFQQYMSGQGSLEQEREKIKHLKENLFKTKKWYENESRKIGSEGLKIISENNLDYYDFKGKSNSFANYFNYLSSFRVDKLIPTKTAIDSLNDIDTWFTRDSKKIEEIKQCYFSGLNSKLEEAITFFQENYRKYATAAEIGKNINLLGILSTLAINIREVQKEKNALLLSEGDKLLNVIIGNNDAPFIYENYGIYLNHFMIDEFQDTSVIQWNNFKPLIENSMDENNSNLIVGDVKQSIYRWRNSNWQLLSSRLEDELKKYSINKQNLNSNWRSNREIVEFNNMFFDFAKDTVQRVYNEELDKDFLKHLSQQYSDTIKNVFADIIQYPESEKEGGLIKIQFIEEGDDSDYDTETINSLIDQIERLQDEGYQASDIAILVRKNDDGNKIANALLSKRTEKTKYNFDVISDDSLFLSSSLSVSFLIGMLRFFVSPGNLIIQSSVAFEYCTNILPLIKKDQRSSFEINKEPDHAGSEVIENYTSKELINEYFPFFKEETDKKIIREWTHLSLLDLVNKLEQDFGLNIIPGEQANLQAFKDTILDFSKKESSNLHKFLDWWNVFGNKIKIQSTAQRDAIRIMTIHKSKGLEFPIVMVPFCDWEFGFSSKQSNILWCYTSKQYSNDFPILPVRIVKGLENTDFAESYFTELLLSNIDNLNLLYVAFTRPIEGLFVFTKKKKDKTKDQKEITDVSDLLKKVLLDDNQQNLHFLKNKKELLYGQLKQKQPKDSGYQNEVKLQGVTNINRNPGTFLRLHKNYENFLDSQNVQRVLKVNEGKLVHEILSKIEKADDLDNALTAMFHEGKIEMGKTEGLKNLLSKLITSDKVKSWFDGTYKILNETTILEPDFALKRPDRVMINGDEAIIVDYKTSSERSIQHILQVKNYSDKIRQMGYLSVKGYIWYLNGNSLISIDSD